MDDSGRLFAAQGIRAFAYGLGAVLLGTVLEDRGWSSGEAALFFAAVLTGTVAANVVVGRNADRWGRRRTYAGLCVSGVVLATTTAPWAMVLVALTGALSTDVIESGPFTTLEQAMLGSRSHGQSLVRGLGRYNAIAAAAGSLGALLVGVPDWIGWSVAPQRLFVGYAIAGALALAQVRRLTAEVEPTRTSAMPSEETRVERRRIRRLAALFSLDSFGGGFVAQSYIAFYLAERFGASAGTIGAAFAILGVLATISFLLAPMLAARIGLLQTMVVTHVPSSVFIACVVLAPSFGVAFAFLAGRAMLSQMDVPTRQAYLLAITTPEERSRAISMTNTARYDAAVWRTFRDVPLLDDQKVVAA